MTASPPARDDALDQMYTATGIDEGTRHGTGGVHAVCSRLGTPPGPEFSRDELRVVAVLAHGLTRTQIGPRLGLPPVAVEAHLGRIAVKVGAGEPAAMVAHCHRRGLLQGEDPPQARDRRPATLTAQEQQFLGLLATPATERQIGAALYLTERHVRALAAALATKLGARTRAHTVHLAYRLALLPAAPTGQPTPAAALRTALARPGERELRAADLTDATPWDAADHLVIPRYGEPALRRDLRQARQGAGLSPHEAAAWLRSEPTTVSNTERGHIPLAISDLRILVQFYRSAGAL